MSVIQGGEHQEPQRGGLDPAVPQVLTGHRITGPLRVGHTADFHDPAAPIVAPEADTMLPGPDGTGYLAGRCGSCVAHPYLALGDGQNLLVVEHQPGCETMAALLAQAGVAR